MSRSADTPARKVPIAAVVGARPNFMKIAPIMKELADHPSFQTSLIHTGQHYDAVMSDRFFEELGIPKPDYHLGVGSGTHGEQTASVLMKIEPVLKDLQPAALFVVGDVNSTLAATIAGTKLNIPIAHIEAGLRSLDRSMPEEINRIMTDSVSHWHFTTEPDAKKNLLREGVDSSRIHFVGNVMIDTLLSSLPLAKERSILQDLNLRKKSYAVLTLHRPSNVDNPKQLQDLFTALNSIHQEIPIIFPSHPRTRKALENNLGHIQMDIQIIEPLGYLDFLCLMASAKMVITDSGGIQEETTVLKVPCLTVRDSTERPITISQGSNILVGANPQALRKATKDVLIENRTDFPTPELWDGCAAKRIIQIMENDLLAQHN